jgi:transcriptional regulator with XRE-family HTH domain
VKPGRVSRETGISTATLTSWKQGKYTPKQDKLQKIADFFGVPLGVITGDMPELDVDYVIKRLEEKEEQQRIDAETSAIYMKEFQEQIR